MCLQRKVRRRHTPIDAPVSIVHSATTRPENRMCDSAPARIDPPFDRWLTRELTRLYGQTLYEPLPPTLAQLAKKLEVALNSPGAQN